MIYVDTSVVLAHLLGETTRPPERLWAETLVSSRLLELELWTRINARGLAESHGELVREALARFALLELQRDVLARALEPFAAPVRTLDAIHLASAVFLVRSGQAVRFATYDQRQRQAAKALGLALLKLD